MLLDETFCSDHLRAIELRLRLAEEPSEGLAASLRTLEEATETRIADPCFVHPATWLRRRLGLTVGEERAVWLLVGCELSPRIRVLARRLATEEVLEPTIDVVRRVIYGGATASACREIEPRGRLFATNLIEATGRDVPASRMTLRLAGRVIALIHGDVDIDPELARIIVPDRETSLADLVVPDAVIEVVASAVTGVGNTITVIAGGRGTGRRSVIAGSARAAGRELLVVDTVQLPVHDGDHVLRAIAREATLLDRAVVLRDLDRVERSRRDEVYAALDRELVQRVRVPIFVTTCEPLRLRWSRPVKTVELRPLKLDERTRIWHRMLPEAPAATARVLAARHPMAPGIVHAAIHAARAQHQELDQACVEDGIRTAIDDGLAAFGARLDTRQTWQDLVLPEDQLAVITELMARAANREQVYDDWGFAAKVGRGLGISALFSGPPGTGKTMVAGLIARDLGLPCYQIDLAKMVSKWVGETEKNLAALFDAAEASHTVLLFDEADSLFGKRTQVSSANDRYANLEVNYLLQRMESFSGISILTTNHETAIDEAFRRRLSLHVRFPVPEVEERERIWQAMLPADVALDDGVDFRGVAARFAMTGGYIKNAVLRAAFLAASEKEAIGMRHFEYAAHVEYEGMGKLAPRRDA